MTIRRATMADVPQILEMAHEFLTTSSYATLAAPSMPRLRALVESMVSGDAFGCFVSESGERLQGMAAAQWFEHPMFELRMASEVVWWVSPSSRGGSIAVRLLAALEAWAREVGAAWLQMVSPSPQVSALYQRRGYVALESAFVRRV